MKEHKMSGVLTLSACARVVAGGVCLSITPTNPESLQAIQDGQVLSMGIQP